MVTPKPSTGERIAVDCLHRLASAVLVRIGMPEPDAAVCADAMVWSDLRGASGSGVAGRLPVVVDRVRAGGVNPAPRLDVAASGAGVALLDADGAWGPVAGTRAMMRAVEAAGRTGVGAVVVRNCDITAALGWYAHVAVERSMIGIAIGNSMPIMAPWGSNRRLLGNQAFAIGAPAGRHHPILFDTALSAMSLHAVRHRDGPLPEGVALDAAGRPTVDPVAALAGSLLPAGGHRGYGLALMWEVLTGVLGGGLVAPDVRGAGPGAPMGITLFCLALDPAAFLPFHEFTARVDTLVDRIHACPPAGGTDRVRVPGEHGFRTAARLVTEGIPVLPSDRAALGRLAEEVAITWTCASGPCRHLEP